MTISETNPLSDSLTYEDLLPVSWVARKHDSQSINYARVDEHNEHVIRCVNLLGEPAKEKTDEESETESALIRLEAKVNLLLEMVTKLDRASVDLPDAAQVRLSAAGIEWGCKEQPPAEGDRIWINIYVDNRIPEAMKLAARVLTLNDAGGVTAVTARFEDMGEVVQDQLEKMIFRHHRRMVAQSKYG